jgi:hypothetical protein
MIKSLRYRIRTIGLNTIFGKVKIPFFRFDTKTVFQPPSDGDIQRDTPDRYRNSLARKL